jgi:general secretion pathway protein I
MNRRQRGFTLIEVVVAFVLLTLVLSVSFEIFSRGMARAGDLDDRARALVVAQSRLGLAGLEDGWKEGVSTGQTDDRRYQWTLTIRRADEIAGSADGKPPSSAYTMYRVDVHVGWHGADGREHGLDLATLATGAKPT